MTGIDTELDYDAIVARADALIAGTAQFEPYGPGRLEGQDAIIGVNLDRMVGEGYADETTGDTETFAHYALIGRFILETTSQGFVSIEDARTEEAAKARFAELEAEYAELAGEDEE